MGNWRFAAIGREYPEGMEQEIEAAYKEGCKHGYEKAMEEMSGGSESYGERRFGRGMYGERGSYGGGGGYSGGGSYGERDFDEDRMRDGYGERRGVRGTGRYSRR